MRTLGKKTCTKCGLEKLASGFYRKASHPSGLSSQCKSCIKKYDQSDRGRAAHRRYYHANSDSIKEKVWQYQNTSQGREAQKRYDQSDKGRLSAQQCARRRRERKLGLDVQLNNEQVSIIYERFGDACFNCGQTKELQIDHHYPVVSGAGLSLNNAVLLCQSCNCSKGSKSPEEFYAEKQLRIIEDILRENS